MLKDALSQLEPEECKALTEATNSLALDIHSVKTKGIALPANDAMVLNAYLAKLNQSAWEFITLYSSLGLPTIEEIRGEVVRQEGKVLPFKRKGGNICGGSCSA